MMNRIKQTIFSAALMVLASVGTVQAQRPSAADRVAREKQNVYAKLTDLTKNQKLLLDGIYEEFAQSYTEMFDEIRKTRNYSKLGEMMKDLGAEKNGLMADVLNDDQFVVFKKVTEGKAGLADTTQYRSGKKWSVQGVLADGDDATEVVGATVLMVNVRDSTQSKYAITDVNGAFKIENAEESFYNLSITSIGYKPYSKVVRLGVVDMNLGRVFVKQDSKLLEAIEVKGDVVAMEIKGDTLQYNADAFKVNQDASTKDLVSKMPGIVVDGTGVSANGETIQQVLLDGKRFFGQDPLLSLNTIPAEVVKNVQVFDQQSEQSQFTGVDDGNTTKTMNVVTKEGKKNGKFGKFYGGYGTGEYYNAGFNLNSFKGDKRISLIGMSNNVNIQNFSSEDLAGVGGGGSRRGGSRRGGSSGGFLTGTQSGITKTNAIGLNFSNKLGEKATIESSYFYNQTDNTTEDITNRQFATNGSDYYSAENRSDTDNENHRVNMRIDYNINKNNRLVIRPTFSTQNNESIDYSEAVTRDENGDVIKETENNYLNLTKSYNFRNDLDFTHKFKKLGRTFSIELENTIGQTDRTNLQNELLSESGKDSLTNYYYDTDEKEFSYNLKVNYAEPVGSNGSLSVEYEIDNNDDSSDKKAYIGDQSKDINFNFGLSDFDFNSQLSNEFESNYTTHQSKLAYTNRGFGKFFRIQGAFQHAVLNNDQFFPEEGTFQRKFNNFIPSMYGRLTFKGGGDMFFRYSGDTDEPSVNQLQNVVDQSNTLLWSLGNPNLKQSYTHSLYVRMGKSNIDKNTSLSNSFSARTTADYVTNETQFANQDLVLDGIEVPRGTQISRPINLGGYWNASNNTTFGVLVSKLKTNINTSIGINYSRQPGLNNGIKNLASTYSGSGKVSFVSNISKDVDFNVYYSASTNTVVNSAETRGNANSNYITQTIGGKVDFTFWKGVVFRSTINYQKYDGVNEEFNTIFTLWNMSIAKKFLKNNMGELELSVFDLLNQNRSVSQSISAAYLQETRTQVLQQYFMMTFTYQLRKFTGASSSQGRGQGGGPRGNRN